MQFNRINPPTELKNIVECYWTVEGSDPTPFPQKIIPDGFPEIIFHFGDPYRIKLVDKWGLQSSSLLAGQITKYFFLENTGTTFILGIKLKPAAVTHLFGIDMSLLKDQVINIADSNSAELKTLADVVCETPIQQRMEAINNHLKKIYLTESNALIDKVIDRIFASLGMISIKSLCEEYETSERQMERMFKKHIGLSPKFYSRIIRFNNIFQVAQTKKISWSAVGLESGFYDQAHFIKDFKAFTGEDPSKYFFDQPTLGNFFMKKK